MTEAAATLVSDAIREMGLRSSQRPDPEDWDIEVVDVFITPGQDPEGVPNWLAYGTLRTTRLSPLIEEGAQWLPE